jgi:hypothetical protein
MTYSEIFKFLFLKILIKKIIIMSTKINLMIITNSVKQCEAQILQTTSHV